jgi:hypothetical protein
VVLFISNLPSMLRLKGNRSKASSMDVDLSQDVYDQDLTDLTSSDASHMMCDPDLVDKVPILFLRFDARSASFAGFMPMHMFDVEILHLQIVPDSNFFNSFGDLFDQEETWR